MGARVMVVFLRANARRLGQLGRVLRPCPNPSDNPRSVLFADLAVGRGSEDKFLFEIYLDESGLLPSIA